MDEMSRTKVSLLRCKEVDIGLVARPTDQLMAIDAWREVKTHLIFSK
jgi:hypothetical protein